MPFHTRSRAKGPTQSMLLLALFGHAFSDESLLRSLILLGISVVASEVRKVPRAKTSAAQNQRFCPSACYGMLIG